MKSASPTSILNLSPADLFLQLVDQAEAMSSRQRQTATKNEDFKSKIAKALQINSGQEAVDAIKNLIQKESVKALPIDKNGCILSAMQAIDECFFYIHPRAQFVPAKKPQIPSWLRDLRDNRFLSGAYASNDNYRLVARGPLLRRDRDEIASNAENFMDRFAALSIVKHGLMLNTRTIKIQHIVIGLSAADGVVGSKNPGHEEIIFIPIAEKKIDLVLTQRDVSGQGYVDYRLNSALDAANIIHSTLCMAGGVDIAFAPELVTTEASADSLALMLGNRAVSTRLIIAGSGHTNTLSVDNVAWNEACILNGKGAELWRQRKLWPAGLTADQAEKYYLDKPTSELLMEDNAEGDMLVVADVDGLGRCVVLICQDIEAQPLSNELVRQFQPDWVFIPVLDPGVLPGRWAHARAFNLSDSSNARFMVSSSLALADLLVPPVVVSCGMAVGPKAANVDDGDAGRVFKEVSVEPGSSPAFARLIWRSAGWQQTKVIVEDVK